MCPERCFTLTAEAEKEMATRVQEEMAERQNDQSHNRLLPTDLPGDHLVSLIGELALSIPTQSLRAYEHTFWPKVRQVLGSPGNLLTGSYEWVIAETEKILFTEMRHFALAAAQSSNEAAAIISLFAMRLDAGFFMTGLKTLWPMEASMLVRRLWNECGLDKWDKLLKRNAAELRHHAPAIRELMAYSPAHLDENCFGPLLDIARPENSSRIMVTVKDSGPELSAMSAVVLLRPSQIFLIHDLLLQMFPAEMEKGSIRLIQDVSTGITVIRHLDFGWENGVIFLTGAGDSAVITITAGLRELLSSRLKGLWFFETCSACAHPENFEEFEELADQPATLMRFVGVLPSSKIIWAKGVESADVSVIEIKKKDVQMNASYDDTTPDT